MKTFGQHHDGWLKCRFFEHRTHPEEAQPINTVFSPTRQTDTRVRYWIQILGDITGNGTAISGLGGAAGYGETALPRGDDVVTQVNVAAVFESGFTMGGVHYDADDLFISTDGLISFGSAVSGVAADASAIAAPFFAVFNGDVDTRLDGEGAESGGVWLDVDEVQDCVTITWDHVGFYRRNATRTDTFQMQLFDRGNGSFDVVYRYQNISWTSGDLQGGWGGLGGVAALIGHRVSASGAATMLAASGDETAELGLANAMGNTGVQGLWVWSFVAPSLIIGTSVADALLGTPAEDTMRGLGGSDVLSGSAGADVLDGGTGHDVADYGAASAAVRIDLVTLSANLGFAAGDTFILIEAYVGSGFADSLLGGAAADDFAGGSGADVLDGRSGNDQLYGGAGADLLRGDVGTDLLDGGTEDDTLYGNGGRDEILGGAGRDSLIGGSAEDTLYGGDDADFLYGGGLADVQWGGSGEADRGDRLTGGRGRDELHGGAASDTLNGGAGFDTVFGDDGDDLLFGLLGNDHLFGSAGADQLKGGAGDDTLDGGLGNDTVTGGDGADAFRYTGAIGQGSDSVTDFDNSAGDHLLFGIAGATKADFSVTFVTLAGAGRAGVAEACITYLPLNRLVWILVDGADEAAILLQSSMNSFDLL